MFALSYEKIIRLMILELKDMRLADTINIIKSFKQTSVLAFSNINAFIIIETVFF